MRYKIMGYKIEKIKKDNYKPIKLKRYICPECKRLKDDTEVNYKNRKVYDDFGRCGISIIMDAYCKDCGTKVECTDEIIIKALTHFADK